MDILTPKTPEEKEIMDMIEKLTPAKIAGTYGYISSRYAKVYAERKAKAAEKYVEAKDTVKASDTSAEQISRISTEELRREEATLEGLMKAIEIKAKMLEQTAFQDRRELKLS